MNQEITYQKIWETLSGVNCNEQTNKKGGLTYLSWAWAWGILMKYYPSATFEFGENETHADGSMTVHCVVTIGECTRPMWLPVMDYKNQAIKSPNARDISDNKMRCLTKALALYGLAHYIYAGEDIPSQNAGSSAPTSNFQLKDMNGGIFADVKTPADVIKECRKKFSGSDNAKELYEKNKWVIREASQKATSKKEAESFSAMEQWVENLVSTSSE